MADWLEVEEYEERDRNSSGFKSCYQEDDYTSTVNASATMGSGKRRVVFVTSLAVMQHFTIQLSTVTKQITVLTELVVLFLGEWSLRILYQCSIIDLHLMMPPFAGHWL